MTLLCQYWVSESVQYRGTQFKASAFTIYIERSIPIISSIIFLVVVRTHAWGCLHTPARFAGVLNLSRTVQVVRTVSLNDSSRKNIGDIFPTEMFRLGHFP